MAWFGINGLIILVTVILLFKTAGLFLISMWLSDIGKCTVSKQRLVLDLGDSKWSN